MDMVNSERAALAAALFRLGIELDEVDKEKLLRHIHLVIQKNDSINLTRITSPEEAIVLHIEDSLSALSELRDVEGEFCDIGTGGGFPGIPLGIASHKRGVLLDSVKKKARAVQEFIEDLGLEGSLQCFGKRSEEFAREQGERFSCVIARAVSALPVVEELATPLLKRGGRLIAMRGTEPVEEQERALLAAAKLGLEFVRKREFEIGDVGERYQRSLYVFERRGGAQVALPRRPGMAVKKPLA